MGLLHGDWRLPWCLKHTAAGLHHHDTSIELIWWKNVLNLLRNGRLSNGMRWALPSTARAVTLRVCSNQHASRYLEGKHLQTRVRKPDKKCNGMAISGQVLGKKLGKRWQTIRQCFPWCIRQEHDLLSSGRNMEQLMRTSANLVENIHGSGPLARGQVTKIKQSASMYTNFASAASNIPSNTNTQQSVQQHPVATEFCFTLMCGFQTTYHHTIPMAIARFPKNT